MKKKVAIEWHILKYDKWKIQIPPNFLWILNVDQQFSDVF